MARSPVSLLQPSAPAAAATAAYTIPRSVPMGPQPAAREVHGWEQPPRNNNIGVAAAAAARLPQHPGTMPFEQSRAAAGSLNPHTPTARASRGGGSRGRGGRGGRGSRGGRGAGGGRKGSGGALVTEAAAWLGVGAGELASSDEERGSGRGGGGGGGGGGGSKRRRTDLVPRGSVVQGGTVQMAFEGGCYGSVQVSKATKRGPRRLRLAR